MKKSLFCLLVLTTVLSCASAPPADSRQEPAGEATSPTVAQPPSFTVCSGTYALCTTAQCSPVSDNDSLLSCGCTVEEGFSAGAKSCDEVPEGPPTAGETIPSRYYPIQNMAVCANSRKWAYCLDKKCTVDVGLSTATCTCDSMSTPTQAYVVVTESYGAATCTTDTWSSATVNDVLQVTAFLEGSRQLPPSPITIVGVGGAN